MVASMDDLEGVEGEEMVEQVVVDKVDGGDGEDGEQEVLLETVSIAGFWRRVGAVVVDWLLMGVVLWILALSLGEIAYRLGPWGRLVGYSLAVLYWGYGNSEQRRGQTVGKRLLGVAVVDKNYEYLSWPRATARAVVLSLILMLNGWAVVESAFWLVATMINMVVFISILLLLYGFIFNRTTRQGAHDLLLGTYVIRVQPEQEVVSLPDLPVLHKRFMYGIVGVVIFAYLGCAGLTLMGTEEVGGTVNVVPTSIAELQDAILAEFDINYLHIESRTIWSNGGGTNILIITGWVTMSCDRYRGDCQRLLDDIEELVAAEYDEVEQYDRLQVRVVNGFDFGLVSGSSYVGSDGAMVRIGG